MQENQKFLSRRSGDSRRRLIWLLIVGYSVLAFGITASFYILRNDQDGVFELAKLLLFLFIAAVALFVVEYVRARLTRGEIRDSNDGERPAR